MAKCEGGTEIKAQWGLWVASESRFCREVGEKARAQGIQGGEGLSGGAMGRQPERTPSGCW